jgi:hypothetical protein
MSDEELEALVKIYGNQQNDVQYLNFINDANPKKGELIAESTGTKGSYFGTTLTFKGAENFDELMRKVKSIIKKDRIRLGEFF